MACSLGRPRLGLAPRRRELVVALAGHSTNVAVFMYAFWMGAGGHEHRAMQCMMSKTRKNLREMFDIRDKIPGQCCCLGPSTRIVVAQVALSFLSKERIELLSMDCVKFAAGSSVKCLPNTSIDRRNAHAVVLVSGATRFHIVQNVVQNFVNGKEADKFANLDEVVLSGAAVQAAIFTGEGLVVSGAGFVVAGHHTIFHGSGDGRWS